MLMSSFAEAVVNAMSSHLCNEMKKNVVVKQLDVVKTNDSRKTGITIREEGCEIAPTFYLEEAYEQFENGKPFDLIIRELTDSYISATEDMPSFDIDSSFKISSLSARVVNISLNSTLLESTPYRCLGHNLAYIADFEFNESYRTRCTAGLLRTLNLSAEDVLDKALANSAVNKPATLMSFPEGFSAPLKECPSEFAKDSKMLVLTTDDGINGAISLFYPDTLKRIAELLQEDFYIIPSSVHEWIIVRAQGQCDAHILWMLTSANESVVSADEVLSNTALFYEVATATLRDVA